MNTDTSAIRDAFAARDFEQALTLAGERVAANEDDGDAWEWVGVINSAVGDFVAAVNGFEHASALIPIRPTSQIQLATAVAGESNTSHAASTVPVRPTPA